MSTSVHSKREAAWDVSHDTEHRLRSENLAFDIGRMRVSRARTLTLTINFLSDVWYPRLAHITPRTVFIPMRKSEAAAIKACAPPAPLLTAQAYLAIFQPQVP